MVLGLDQMPFIAPLTTMISNGTQTASTSPPLEAVKRPIAVSKVRLGFLPITRGGVVGVQILGAWQKTVQGYTAGPRCKLNEKKGQIGKNCLLFLEEEEGLTLVKNWSNYDGFTLVIFLCFANL